MDDSTSDATHVSQVEIDDRLAGINFIEVLFALVVARTLEPIADYQKIPAVGWSHLVVAGVLTIASWIGYHNSQNRPRFFIRFRSPLWPLWQFSLDVSLVVVYWLTAISAEGTGSKLGETPSARPEALLVAVAFLLYCLWDEVGLRMRRDRRFGRRLIENDNKNRRMVTRYSALVAVLAAAGVWAVDPMSTEWIVTIDGLLVLLLIGFRVAKDLWHRNPVSVAGADRRDSSALLNQIEAGVRALRRSVQDV